MTEIPGLDSGHNPVIPSGENKELNWQRETIKNNEVVTIPVGTSQSRADVMGGEVYAKLKLGGISDGSYEPQDLELVYVNWKEDPEYQGLARRAKAAGILPTNVLIVAYQKGKGITGSAFLPEHSISTLGRDGSLQWFDYGLDRGIDPGWTPFEDNMSISRRQLSIHPLGGKMAIIGLSENSHTEIEAPWIKKEGPKG
jgi:hypothetical protein